MAFLIFLEIITNLVGHNFTTIDRKPQHKEWNKITFYQKKKENGMLEQLTFLNGVMIERDDIPEKNAWLGDLLVTLDKRMFVRNFTYERDPDTDSSEYK